MVSTFFIHFAHLLPHMLFKSLTDGTEQIPSLNGFPQDSTYSWSLLMDYYASFSTQSSLIPILTRPYPQILSS